MKPGDLVELVNDKNLKGEVLTLGKILRVTKLEMEGEFCRVESLDGKKCWSAFFCHRFKPADPLVAALIEANAKTL